MLPSSPRTTGTPALVASSSFLRRAGGASLKQLTSDGHTPSLTLGLCCVPALRELGVIYSHLSVLRRAPPGLCPHLSLSPLYAALQALLESMVDAAENLCPNVMKKAHIRQDLIHASTEKISIPRTFVKNVLLEQSGIDILNKIR